MKGDRHLTAVFCDDVRPEQGNKLSFMGIYTGMLVVPNFPTTLPRLCVVLTLRVSPDMIPSDELRFRLYKGDEVIAEQVVPTEALSSARSASASPHMTEDRFASFGSIFQLFPVPLSEPCFFRARAVCDGEEVRGGSLAIVEQKDFEHAAKAFAGLEEIPFP